MDKQREAFEAWCYTNGVKLHDYEAELCWQAWQAAQQALQAPLRMVDPIRHAMGLVNEWNEGAADADEWGNEACQAMFALSDCIKTLLIEAGTQPQWLPIETAPREELRDLIVFNGKVQHGAYWEERWIDSGHDWMNPQPTHWMPLPPEPQQ